METQSGVASPHWGDNETDFPDPDVNSQNYSVPMQEELFQDDSTIDIYKTITGEVLHVIFKGIFHTSLIRKVHKSKQKHFYPFFNILRI